MGVDPWGRSVSSPPLFQGHHTCRMEGVKEWGRGDRRRFQEHRGGDPTYRQGPSRDHSPRLSRAARDLLLTPLLSLSCPLQCFDDNLRPASHHSILVLGLQGWETLLGPTLWFSIWKPRAKNLARVTHRGVAKPPRDSKSSCKASPSPQKDGH